MRKEAPTEGSGKREAPGRQVCGQSREPETRTAMLRSKALIVWDTGEPRKL